MGLDQLADFGLRYLRASRERGRSPGADGVTGRGLLGLAASIIAGANITQSVLARRLSDATTESEMGVPMRRPACARRSADARAQPQKTMA